MLKDFVVVQILYLFLANDVQVLEREDLWWNLEIEKKPVLNFINI